VKKSSSQCGRSGAAIWFHGRIPTVAEGVRKGTLCRGKYTGSNDPYYCCDDGRAEAEIKMCSDGNPAYRYDRHLTGMNAILQV